MQPFMRAMTPSKMECEINLTCLTAMLRHLSAAPELCPMALYIMTSRAHLAALGKTRVSKPPRPQCGARLPSTGSGLLAVKHANPMACLEQFEQAVQVTRPKADSFASCPAFVEDVGAKLFRHIGAEAAPPESSAPLPLVRGGPADTLAWQGATPPACWWLPCTTARLFCMCCCAAPT